MRSRLTTFAVCAGVVASIWAQSPPAFAADQPPIAADAQAAKTQVPVTHVMLYSSGVGFFEHMGKVNGNASSELRFRTAQINDVLKSLVLQDLDGGTISTITYPSQDPLGKTLSSFQIDISNNPSLADLLNQLRGAKITVTTIRDEALSGTVVGIEKRQEPVDPKEPQKMREISILTLLTEAGLQPLKIDEVRGIRLEDPQLRKELEQALAAVATARDADKKPVTIDFRGNGERRVRVGYVVETPVWKISYRLLLPDKPEVPEKGHAPKASLQGWAIVENQTESDWNDIGLNLVSGRPISFVQDLYQALYVPRPVVVPELYASLRPQNYEGGISAPAADMAQAMGAPPAAPMAAARAMRKSSPRGGELQEKAAESDARGFGINGTGAGGGGGGWLAGGNVQSVASAENVGELFSYSMANVSLPRQKSAMIPVITDSIEAERLSIYNPNVLAKHPLTGARLKNTSGKHLMQGPITVVRGGGYAGDARIDDVPPGQERLLSYGIDQEIRVDSNSQNEEQSVIAGSIVKGVLQLTLKNVATRAYAAENKGTEDRVLLVEHPRRQGWKLVSEDKPVESTEQLYRFQTPSPAGKQIKLVVREELVNAQGIELLRADIGTLQIYLRQGEIPQPVKDALIKAISMKQAVMETDRQINEKRNRINQITAEQNRLRENIKSVAANTEYSNKLVKKLSDQETQLEELQKQIDELTKQREKQQADLDTYLTGLKV